MATVNPLDRGAALKRPSVADGNDNSVNQSSIFKNQLNQPILIASASNLSTEPKSRAKYKANDYIGTHQGFVAQLNRDGKTVSINGHKYNLPLEAIRQNESGNGIGIQQTIDKWWANPQAVSAAMSGGRSSSAMASKPATVAKKSLLPKKLMATNTTSILSVPPLFQGALVTAQKAFGDTRPSAKIAEDNNRVLGQTVGSVVNPYAQTMGVGRPIDPNWQANIYADVLPKGVQNGNVTTTTGRRYAVRQANGMLTVFSPAGKAYKDQPNNAGRLSRLTYDGVPYARENAEASRLQGNKPSTRTLPSGEKISVLKESAGLGVIVTGKDGIARRYKSVSDAEKSSNYGGRAGDNLKWSLLKLADGQQVIIAKDGSGNKFVTLEMENGQGREFRPAKNARMYVFDEKQSNDAITHSELLGQTRAYLDNWAKVGNWAAGVGRSAGDLVVGVGAFVMRHPPLASGSMVVPILPPSVADYKVKQAQLRAADKFEAKSTKIFDDAATAVRANPKSEAYANGLSTGNIGLTIASLFVPGPQEATLAKVGGQAVKISVTARALQKVRVVANALKNAKIPTVTQVKTTAEAAMEAGKSQLATAGKRLVNRAKVAGTVTVGVQGGLNAAAVGIKVGADSVIARRVTPAIVAQNLEKELRLLSANPDKYMLKNYRSRLFGMTVASGAPTSNGHLLQGAEGDGSVYFMRRVPDDLFNVLKNAQEKRGLKSGRVYVVEAVKDNKGKPQNVWVEIKPPVRTDKFIGDGGFMQIAKGSNAYSYFKRRGLKIGASDQIQLAPVLTEELFNKPTSTKKSTLRVSLNSEKAGKLVDEVDVRQQVTTLHDRLAIRVGGFTLNGGNFIDRDAPKSFANGTQVMGGSTNIYLDAGARERRQTGKKADASSGYTRQRVTGMIELGAGPEFIGLQTAAGQKTTANGYLEAQYYPLNSYLEEKNKKVKPHQTYFKVPVLIDLAFQGTTQNVVPEADIHVPNLIHSADGFVTNAPNKGKWPVVVDINKPPN